MRRLSYLSLLIALFFPCGDAFSAEEPVRIKGSDTIGGRALPEVAEAYRKKHGDIRFEIGALGSSTAFVGRNTALQSLSRRATSAASSGASTTPAPESPCESEFARLAALPSSLTGPFERAPLRREASAWSGVDTGGNSSNPSSVGGVDLPTTSSRGLGRAFRRRPKKTALGSFREVSWRKTGRNGSGWVALVSLGLHHSHPSAHGRHIPPA